jgi:G3E family GTPase
VNQAAVVFIPVTVLAVTDAFRWKRLCRAMSVMIESRLDCSDFILVNKIDLVDEEAADAVVKISGQSTGKPSYIKRLGHNLYMKAYGQR